MKRRSITILVFAILVAIPLLSFAVLSWHGCTIVVEPDAKDGYVNPYRHHMDSTQVRHD